jgi:hypothetical protein
MRHDRPIDEPARDHRRFLGTYEERAPALQWVGFFLAPAAFFTHLQIGYVLVPWACTMHGEIWIHVVGVLSMALAAAGTAVAWRVHARADNDQPNEGGGSVPRTRFVGVVGIGSSGMFTLILFAQWIVAFFISPCQ